MFSFFRTLEFKKKDAAALCIVAILLIFALIQWWLLPLTPELFRMVENPYFTTLDTEGNAYVVNAGKSEILKISPEKSIIARMSWSDRGEDVFSEANEVAVDSEGNIYVQDVIWNDTGLGLATERIIRFDPNGRFRGVVYENNYVDAMVMKRQLFSLVNMKGEIWFIGVDAENQSCSIYTVTAQQEYAKEVRSLKYSEVENVQDFAVGPEGVIYSVDKYGEIYQSKGEDFVCLYRSPEKKWNMPYYIHCSEDGMVYFTDICSQEIYRIEDQKVIPFLDCEKLGTITGMELSDSILETIQIRQVNKKQFLCLTCNDRSGYIDLETEEYTGFGKLPYTTSFQILIAARFAAVLLAAMLLVYYLLAFLRYLIRNRTLEKNKTGIILVVGVLIAASVVMSSMLTRFKDIYIEQQLNSMCSVTQIATKTIDVNAFSAVAHPTDYGSENYQKLQQNMRELIDVVSPYSENMYCNLAKMNEDRCYAIAFLDNSIGAYYPLDAGEAEEVKQVYEQKENYINDGKSDATGNYVYVKTPIINEDGSVAGIVEVGMVSDTLSSIVNELRVKIMVEILLMVIIAAFLLNECMAFFGEHREWKKKRQQTGGKAFPVSWFRVLVFLCFAAYNMPTSFLPVYMESFYETSMPFRIELAGSLPLTLNFMIIGLMSLVCARFIRKLGFCIVSVAGTLFCLSGDLMMALAGNYWMAVAGLVCSGIGCGFFMNGLSIIVANQDEEGQASGFPVMNGALLSGMISGTVIGAALAENVGEADMFFFSSGVWLMLAVITLFAGRYFSMGEEKQESNGGKNILWLLRSGRIVSYLILLVVPFTIINGFTSYFLPIFGDSYGLTESQTSLLLVMNCMVGIFLSGTLTRIMYRNFGRAAVYLASILSLTALILFGYFPNLYMLAFALFILGAAKSFGGPLREMLFCTEPGVQSFGEDKAMGIYNFVDNVGDSLGTVTFGSILNIGFSTGIWVLAGISGLALGVYEFLIRKKQE